MGEKHRYAEPPSITFSPEDLGRVLPFFLLLDSDGVVEAGGQALLKLLGQKNVVGRSVFDILDIVKPRRFDQNEALRDILGQRLRLELKGLENQAPSTLFGMAFPVRHNGKSNVLVAATPGVNARSFVEVNGLKISDFGPADGSADLLPLLAMQDDMLEDIKKKSARLTEARDAAERLANHDALTGLPNRRALMKTLSVALNQAAVSVVHLDLDRFKELNDTYGHAAGDAALKHAATAMADVFGDRAVCARIGGDEFVAVMKNDASEDTLRHTSEALLAQISEPFVHENEHLTIGASIGLARAKPTDELTADDILHHSDLALYAVKRSERGHIVMCTPDLLSEQMAFQTLTSEMRNALAERQFEAYLQPQIEAKTGSVLGFEALVRWHHPTRGVLMPGQFLPEAERAGILQEIDDQVRRSALNTLIESDNTGAPIPKVGLNVTVHDLVDPSFREDLVWRLKANDLDIHRVQLEIVESVLFDRNTGSISDACQALVEEGFVLALDDFGTGHASVLSLMNLPIAIAKIDRAFTNGVARDSRKEAMARALVGIAQTLGLEVLAEGVNNHDDVNVLRSMGCEFFQSYHFGKPMAPKDALNWMVDRQSFSSSLDHRNYDQRV